MAFSHLYTANGGTRRDLTWLRFPSHIPELPRHHPSLKEEDLVEGDLRFTNDFRSTYATILDEWLRLDEASVLGGQFEQIGLIRK